MVYDHQDKRGEKAIMQIDNMSIWLQNGGKIVPGQNDTFAPVVPRVPGQFSRCPCGVGAYVDALKQMLASLLSTAVIRPRNYFSNRVFKKPALCFYTCCYSFMKA